VTTGWLGILRRAESNVADLNSDVAVQKSS